MGCLYNNLTYKKNDLSGSKSKQENSRKIELSYPSRSFKKSTRFQVTTLFHRSHAGQLSLQTLYSRVQIPWNATKITFNKNKFYVQMSYARDR